MTSAINGLVFDAYGTLYDVHSVVARCDALWPGRGNQVSSLWRSKQLEWTWQRSLMGRYVSFREITISALRYACASLNLPCTDTAVNSLMAAYLQLAPFPDVAETLEALRPRRMAILSNGSPDMLEPLVTHSGLGRWITDIISVDSIRTFKPAPSVYRLGADRLGEPPESIGFVSSNCWDVCGAKAFGFSTYWINRSHAPVDNLGAAPDESLASLAELPGLLSD